MPCCCRQPLSEQLALHAPVPKDCAAAPTPARRGAAVAPSATCRRSARRAHALRPARCAGRLSRHLSVTFARHLPRPHSPKGVVSQAHHAALRSRAAGPRAGAARSFLAPRPRVVTCAGSCRRQRLSKHTTGPPRVRQYPGIFRVSRSLRASSCRGYRMVRLTIPKITRNSKRSSFG